MNPNWKPVAAIVALALSASPAFAAKQFFNDRLTFSAFGSAGAAQTNTNVGQFKRDDQLSGADKEVDVNVDTNLGLQLTGKATDWLSATVQSLTMQRGDGKISTELEWAYLKIQPTRSISMLAGRMTLPMFLVSDYRNVGYANTWLRPPNEVYGMALLHRLEGATLSYALPIKETTLTISGMGGKSEAAAFGIALDMKHVRGVNLMWESDELTLRAGRVEAVPDTVGDLYQFSGVGATYEHNKIITQAEFVARRSKRGFDAIVDADGWYTLAGYRINKFVPYVSYADTRPKTGGAFGHLSETQSTIAAGLRWDAFSSSAIKFQVERIDTHDTPGISFTTPVIAVVQLPVYEPITKPVTAVSLAMDMVF